MPHSWAFKIICFWFLGDSWDIEWNVSLLKWVDTNLLPNWYSPVRMKINRTFPSIWLNKSCNIPLESPIKLLPKMKKKMKFSTFVSFLGQSFKKWCFVTLKPLNIFEWNFQQSFLIEIHEKWIHNGLACPPFHACLAHFSKTLIFQKWP